MKDVSKVLKEYQRRIVIEKVKLDRKHRKLVDFIQTDVFDTLPDDEKERLKRQSAAMKSYSNILTERILAVTA